MGTPDHNNWLPPAFASYEPHHDRGFDGLADRHKDHPTQGGPGTLRAKPVEPSKLRNQTSRNPHIINQALMGSWDEDSDGVRPSEMGTGWESWVV